MTIKYDGLNRQVSRTIGGTTTYSVWDGWDLIEEYQAGGITTAAYLYGATGLISGVTNGYFAYYFQDASGSTSHVTDANGHLLEWYRYDLQGTPVFYNASDQQISASAFGVRQLFTGQQWRSELGLYDLRNRFYSPDLGRFLQPDPIGFWGDRSNLYRYCGNNPVTRWDPFGLEDPKRVDRDLQNTDTYSQQTVTGSYTPPAGHTNLLPAGLFTGGRGPGGGGGGPIGVRVHGTHNSQGHDVNGSNVQMQNIADGLAQTEQVFVSASWVFPTPPILGPIWNALSGGPSWAPFYRWLNLHATPEEIAWTNTGKWPTLILTIPILAPLAAPETGLYATAATYNALATAGSLAASGTNVALTGANAAASWAAYQVYLNPAAVVNANQFIQGYLSPGIPPTNPIQTAGLLTRDLQLYYIYGGR
jgi:RHS repeat-associated protein